MMYTPNHVANFMLDRAETEGLDLTPMKLLKLVYIGYGWVLAVLDKRLFEEPIEAWAHGPVVKSLYHEFKHFGRDPISGRSIEFDLEDFSVQTPRIGKDDNHTLLVLGIVWNIYKKFSAWDLRNKTHEPGSPWSKVYRPNSFGIVIPDELIKRHFTNKISAYLDHAA